MGRLLKRLLREPFLHFLLIGAALFGAYRLANRSSSDGTFRSAGAPDLDSVRDVAAREWSRARRLEANRRLEARLREEFEVTIERPAAGATGAPREAVGR